MDMDMIIILRLYTVSPICNGTLGRVDFKALILINRGITLDNLSIQNSKTILSLKECAQNGIKKCIYL